MLRRKYFLLILPAILFLVQNGNAAFRGFRASGGRSESYNQQQYRNNYYKGSSIVAGAPNQASAHLSDEKLSIDGMKSSNNNKGLSAWGIVALVIGIILLGTGGYYAFVFYPYICKKERNYDMIELTNVL